MIRITKENKIVNAIVPLTPSKSITNRVLIINALCDNKIVIQNPATADDSKILADVLKNLQPEIQVNNAGTTFRFLTSLLSIQKGTFILDGSDRMKQRPIGALVNALRSLGAEIDFTGKENFPPLKIYGRKITGGKLSIDASESSQFISSLLLIAPQLEHGLELNLTGKINSKPYIDMTLSLMNYFGIQTYFKDDKISISNQDYIPKKIIIESDWSSASFWYETAALSDESEIILKGLNKNSIQGDVVIADIMKNFGIESEFNTGGVVIRKNISFKLPSTFEYDFSSCPDLVIPVAVTCSVLKIKSTFRGVKNLRIKESDRLEALKIELEKIGSSVLLQEDSMIVHPSGNLSKNILFQSYNDHRMVMAMAPLAMVMGEIRIDDHLPVIKSYPEFWNQLQSAGFHFEII